MQLIEPFIRAYRSLFSEQGLLASLFTIYALSQLRYTWRVLQAMRRQGKGLSEPPLTFEKKRLVDEAAVYVAVPISIFLHEFGHAVAVWAFGGHVVEFGFFFFWGYVLPDRAFPPTAQWIISSAGTWANLGLALAVWLAWRRRAAPVWRYAAVRVARFQLIFALIMYPVFTALLALGDWRVIYNFNLTPILSGLTGLAHSILLIGLWRSEQMGHFEMPAFATAAAEAQAGQLAAGLSADPDNLPARMALLRAYAVGDAPHRALALAKDLTQRWPDSAENHFLLAVLQTQSRRRVPRQAVHHFQQAIRLGLTNPAQLATAQRWLGLHYLDREDFETALHHFDQAIDAAVAAVQAGYASAQIDEHDLHYWRSIILRQKKRYAEAQQDLRLALAQAEASNLPQAAALYREQLKSLDGLVVG